MSWLPSCCPGRLNAPSRGPSCPAGRVPWAPALVASGLHDLLASTAFWAHLTSAVVTVVGAGHVASQILGLERNRSFLMRRRLCCSVAFYLLQRVTTKDQWKEGEALQFLAFSTVCVLTGAQGRKLPKQKKKGKWLLGITKSSCDPFSPPVIRPKPVLLVLPLKRIQNHRPVPLASPPDLSSWPPPVVLTWVTNATSELASLPPVHPTPPHPIPAKISGKDQPEGCFIASVSHELHTADPPVASWSPHALPARPPHPMTPHLAPDIRASSWYPPPADLLPHGDPALSSPSAWNTATPHFRTLGLPVAAPSPLWGLCSGIPLSAGCPRLP